MTKHGALNLFRIHSMAFCGRIIIIIIRRRIAVIVVVITIITININVLIFSKYFGMYLVVSPLRTDMSCHIFKTCWVVETSDLELLFSSGELTVKEKLKLLHAAMADYDSQAFPFRSCWLILNWWTDKGLYAKWNVSVSLFALHIAFVDSCVEIGWFAMFMSCQIPALKGPWLE